MKNIKTKRNLLISYAVLLAVFLCITVKTSALLGVIWAVLFALSVRYFKITRFVILVIALFAAALYGGYLSFQVQTPIAQSLLWMGFIAHALTIVVTLFFWDVWKPEKPAKKKKKAK